MPKEYGTPGPRAIYPEICDSRSLSRCGIVANALWPRLIAKADDQGRVAGDAADILGLCFPKMLDRVTHRQVAQALDELEQQRQIVRYVVDGEPLVQILTWWSWQHSQRRAYPSRHPAPPDWTDFIYGYGDHPKTYREAGGLPPHVRRLPTSSPHAAATESAPSPQEVGIVPPPAHARGRSGASALPDPTRPERVNETVEVPDAHAPSADDSNGLVDPLMEREEEVALW